MPSETPADLPTQANQLVSKSTDTFKIEIVQSIIARRRNSARWAVGIVLVVLFGSTYFDKHYDAEALIIAGSIFVPWFTTLYFVNAANCLQPRTYYRHWNKIVYYSLAKLAVFFNIIDTTGDAKGIFNPWHGLMDSTVSSRPTLLTDMAISAGTGYKIQRSLKPAEYIEAYFKQQLG